LSTTSVDPNVDFSSPTSSADDSDPFARAAYRTKQSVQPEGGRKGRVNSQGLSFPEYYLSHLANGLLTLPQRAFDASQRLAIWGEVDPGPALETATMLVGTPLTPKGALGSGMQRPPRLRMDEASPMARADAMGFQRNMPLEFGTAPAGEKVKSAAFKANGRVFEAQMHYLAQEEAERALGMRYSQMQHDPIAEGFVTNAGRYVSRAEAGDIGRRASQTGESGQFGRDLASEEAKLSNVKPSSTVYTGATAPGLLGGEGPWGWVIPDRAASAPPSPSGRRTQRFPDGEMETSSTQANQGGAIPPGPIWHRSERPTSIDVRGVGESEIRASLLKAWEEGYDSVMLKNYTSPGGRTGTVLVVKDLAQLRSPSAKFDPRKRNSSDLLAGVAGAGVLLPLAEMAGPQSDDAFWEAWRRGDAM
jgi:hypothetical protein